MKQYKLINNALGWFAFLVALVVYTLTLEPTASFWDCGEFLSAADKLQVVHPPGAPMFLLMGKVFTLLALGDQSQVAFWMNMMSATTSAFTILFLFWTITHMGRKLFLQGKSRTSELEPFQLIATMGAGLVGALAFTFSDSFWFSAVEAEVYASSSFFTAITFWCVLKWEDGFGRPHNNKWLILIAYFIGLAIGVHLLNLLVIPAIIFVYYFKKFEVTRWSFIKAFGAAMASVVVVQFFIIPGYPLIAAKLDILFVNSFGLPFNSGLIGLVLILVGLIYWGLKYTKKKGLPLWNTLILCVTFITIGYSSYAMLIIRSIADVPLDHQNVEDPNALLSYLNREQYGERPLLYGQNFDAKQVDVDYGGWQYQKVGDKYIRTTRKYSPIWDKEHMTIFPRMWNMEPDRVEAYKFWEDLQEGDKVKLKNNVHFFLSYQLTFMYWRYFAWNFIGRQSDNQSQGEISDGQVLSGITPIDNMFLGPQENLPESMTKNKGRNTYFFLPFILGILGLWFHYKRDPKDTFVILLLFLFTGFFIIVYLNFPTLQPRERDYAYVGSYQYFCFWVGFGVLAMTEWLRKKINPQTAAILSTTVGLLAAPILMGSQNWDDHNRSNRTVALDCAINYLESCDPNAVLFTNGDNDTYPLWYAQNVEGIRSDVRVINLSLLNTDWYIDVMRRTTYQSKEIPLTLKSEQLLTGKRDILEFIPRKGLQSYGIPDTGYAPLKSIIDFVAREDDVNKTQTRYSRDPDYFCPTNKFSLAVDKDLVLKNKVVEPEDADKIVPAIQWEVGDRSYLMKNALAVLDFIANNNWRRPVYFTITTGAEAYIGLQNYFQLDGMCYKLVPIKSEPRDRGDWGYISKNKLYQTIMKKWRWGGMNREDVYLDETTLRNTRNYRNVVSRLAQSFIEAGDNAKAIEVQDYCEKMLPEKTVSYDPSSLNMANFYLAAGAMDKGNGILDKMIKECNEKLVYFNSLSGTRFASKMSNEIQYTQFILQQATKIKEAKGRPMMIGPDGQPIGPVKKDS